MSCPLPLRTPTDPSSTTAVDASDTHSGVRIEERSAHRVQQGAPDELGEDLAHATTPTNGERRSRADGAQLLTSSLPEQAILLDMLISTTSVVQPSCHARTRWPATRSGGRAAFTGHGRLWSTTMTRAHPIRYEADAAPVHFGRDNSEGTDYRLRAQPATTLTAQVRRSHRTVAQNGPADGTEGERTG